MLNTHQFRYDINGLRAWAVIAVVLYHFKIAGFDGGFVGVDIFFVISGFLMTGIIQRGLDKQRFSLLEFYRARILRIIPSLLAMCATTLVAGYFLLFDREYNALLKETVNALFFVSNYYFMTGSDYFAADAQEKLLLHTWSLAIEWQYYMLLPLIMLTVHRLQRSQHTQIITLCLLTAVSLACLWYFKQQQINAFYPLVTRAWELLFGGLLFYLAQHLSIPERSRKVLEYAGFVCIAYSIYSADSTNWPSGWSLLPVIGCCLVLLSARQQSVLTNNLPFQYIGNWSYSLYLWHWPICALLFITINEPSESQKLLAIAASLILAIITHHSIEQFFYRKDQWQWHKTAATLIGITGIVVCCLFLKTQLLNLERFDETVRLISAGTDDKNPYMRSCSYRELLTENNDNLYPCTYFNGKRIKQTVKPQLIMLGDSHTASIANLVSTINGGTYVKAYAIYTCPPIIGLTRADQAYSCMHLLPEILKEIATDYPSTPVLIYTRYGLYVNGPNERTVRDNINAAKLAINGIKFGTENYRATILSRITDSLCKIAETNPITVIAPTPEMGSHLTKQIARDAILGRLKTQYGISLEAHLQRTQSILASLNQAKTLCNVNIFDPLPHLCTQGYCSAIDGTQVRYFDDDHISQHGSRRFIEPLAVHLNHHHQQLHNKSAP